MLHIQYHVSHLTSACTLKMCEASPSPSKTYFNDVNQIVYRTAWPATVILASTDEHSILGSRFDSQESFSLESNLENVPKSLCSLFLCKVHVNIANVGSIILLTESRHVTVSAVEISQGPEIPGYL
jgi:hypothetical protein